MFLCQQGRVNHTSCKAAFQIMLLLRASKETQQRQSWLYHTQTIIYLKQRMILQRGGFSYRQVATAVAVAETTTVQSR